MPPNPNTAYVSPQPSYGPPSRSSSRPVYTTPAPSTAGRPLPPRPIRPGLGPSPYRIPSRPTIYNLPSGLPVSSSPSDINNPSLSKTWGGVKNLFSDYIDFGVGTVAAEQKRQFDARYGTSEYHQQVDQTASPASTYYPEATQPGGVETAPSTSPLLIGLLALTGLVTVAIIASK